MPDLKEQIAARQKDAEDKQIYERAMTIARHLGNSRLFNGGYRFKNEIFTIILTQYGYGGKWKFSACMKIEYQGKIVFENALPAIAAYIPGPWEKELDSLYERALPLKKTTDEKMKEEHKQSMVRWEVTERKNWGL